MSRITNYAVDPRIEQFLIEQGIHPAPVVETQPEPEASVTVLRPFLYPVPKRNRRRHTKQRQGRRKDAALKSSEGLPSDATQIQTKVVRS